MADHNKQAGSAGGNGNPAAQPETEKTEKNEKTQATVEDIISELEAQLKKSEEAKGEMHDRLLRTAADFENWKKRSKLRRKWSTKPVALC